MKIIYLSLSSWLIPTVLSMSPGSQRPFLCVSSYFRHTFKSSEKCTNIFIDVGMKQKGAKERRQRNWFHHFTVCSTTTRRSATTTLLPPYNHFGATTSVMPLLICHRSTSIPLLLCYSTANSMTPRYCSGATLLTLRCQFVFSLLSHWHRSVNTRPKTQYFFLPKKNKK